MVFDPQAMRIEKDSARAFPSPAHPHRTRYVSPPAQQAVYHPYAPLYHLYHDWRKNLRFGGKISASAEKSPLRRKNLRYPGYLAPSSRINAA
jgi:hypothetical protein